MKTNGNTVTAQECEHLMDIIRGDARGKYTLAKFDFPEVLSVRCRPPGWATQRALEAIHSHNINLVVLNHRPPFAGPIAADLQAAIEREFPDRADAGDFEVRWKN